MSTNCTAILAIFPIFAAAATTTAAAITLSKSFSIMGKQNLEMADDNDKLFKI